MRLSHATWVVCLLDLVLPGPPAFAMQFEQIQISATEVIIGGRGPIVKGDAARLDQALAQVPQAKRLLALALDSPGGLVSEGVLLAELIRTRKVPVVIPSNSQCVSACFLLLAASPRRMAASDALVGVHSANENQQETDTSLAVTTLMARDAAKNGIPPAIVGKMVETTPGRVEWLTHDDLVSMNVAVYDGDTPTATRRDGHGKRPACRAGARCRPNRRPRRQCRLPCLPQLPPRATAIPGQTSVPPGFAAGRDDRHAWDAWLAGLQGQYRDGAAFAKAQIGLPRPGSLRRPGMAPIAATSPWVVRPRDSAWPQWPPSSPSTMCRFRRRMEQRRPDHSHGCAERRPNTGARISCGPLVAQLTLKVFPQSGEPRRRAACSASDRRRRSPGVPRGARSSSRVRSTCRAAR